MFTDCVNLVGGAGTAYDSNHIDYTYAHIDGGTSNPGYFTDVNGPSQKVAMPALAWNGDELTISTTTTDAAIYYKMTEGTANAGSTIPAFLSEYATPDELIANGDDDEASAWLWFHENYPNGKYVYFGNISTLQDIKDYGMLFWLRDIETRNVDDIWNISDVAKNAAPAIEQYVKSGGNLLLWSHAVPYIGTINRLPESLLRSVNNAFNCGPGGINTDTWKMGVCVNTGSFSKDFSSHPIYAGIPTEIANEQCFSSIPMKGAGWTEDHNCVFFDIPAQLTGLNNQTKECYDTLTTNYGIYPLGTWDSFVSWTSQLNVWEAKGADMAPEGFQKGAGTVLCIGNGGCEFSMKNEDGTPDKSATPKNNPYQQNILKLASNSIQYLLANAASEVVRYTGPITVTKDVQIEAWAEHMGMISSDTITLDYPYTAWQQLREAIEYSMITVAMCQGSPKVKQEDVVRLQYMAENANAYYSHRELQRDEIERMVGELMVLSAMLRSQLEAVEYVYDSTNGVLTISGGTTVAEALEAAGGSSAASALTSIIWQNTTPLTNDDLRGLDNPNMLIYVADASLAPANRDNVIIGNDSTGYTAMNIVLADVADGNGDFYCPIAFTAEMISYTHEYRQQTEVGVARGWETIAMPFTVQTITHEKNGVISPFGNDASTKHFWLRQLSTNGLVSATKIEANVPYLISMPNDEKNYKKEYILKGLVTFSAQNAVVPKTEPTALALADSSVVMMPALQSVGKSSTVWALNVGQERTQYFEGSTFERDYREVRPFEAYTIHRSDSPAPRFLPINDLMNSATGIETISNVIMTHDNYYHLDGRKVDGKPTKKGLYITNGRKVVIK
jgi:hypothetical protein